MDSKLSHIDCVYCTSCEKRRQQGAICLPYKIVIDGIDLVKE